MSGSYTRVLPLLLTAALGLTPQFALAFAFDTPIGRGAVHAGQTGLISRTQLTGRVMTICLARNPFTPPEPWHVAVVIDFA